MIATPAKHVRQATLPKVCSPHTRRDLSRSGLSFGALPVSMAFIAQAATRPGHHSQRVERAARHGTHVHYL